MKTQFLSFVAVVALAACSGNANKPSEGEQNANQSEGAAVSASPEKVEKAVQYWNEDEMLKNYTASLDTTVNPNQVAYYDIDGDGTAELLLRDWEKEYDYTGFIAVYSIKNDVKKIGLSNNSWETTGLSIYGNGVVRTDRGSEGGADCTSYFFKLKDSDVEAVYIYSASEDIDTGDVDKSYSVTAPGSEPKQLTEDEMRSALGEGFDSYEGALNISDFKWENIK